MNKNAHVTEYLDYYLSLNGSPGFAILLRGEWGSGKTWFIKDYLISRQTLKHLYVSLNGVSSFKEIEDIFFQQLHPLLASKGMKIAGKVLKGIIKTTINVDFNNDGKSDGNFSSAIPDINLPEYFKNIDENIIIFDDLERCAIEPPKILGYINQFVESNGLKVVILANEKEIINKDDKNATKEQDKYLMRIRF